jgi:alpha-D-xyloside xylohydrolase
MILETETNLVSPQQIKGVLDDVVDPYAEGKIVERNDQFMFGPSILVAPFYEHFSEQREVQLPGGNWYDFYTGEFVGNNELISVTCDKNNIPLFVKQGAVIPMLSTSINNTKEAIGHSLEVRIYGSENGYFDVYEDDGVSFNYQKGEYGIRRISVSQDEVSETVIKKGPTLFGSVDHVRLMTR